MMTTQTNQSTSTQPPAHTLGQAVTIADHHARRGVFDEYRSRKAANTLRAQRADLQRLADFLEALGLDASPTGETLATEPEAWRGVTWGLIEGFRNWQVQRGAAISTINRRLSTVKRYAQLASKAGILDSEAVQLIRAVSGYGHQEGRRIDGRRGQTRTGPKKAEHVPLTPEQAQRLKAQPDTPQGRRDALLMCLLLDHGLRCGELAALTVDNFDPGSALMRFYRAKVDKTQTHRLSADTLRALDAWIQHGDAPAVGPLLRGSRKGGHLIHGGMSVRAITARVRVLGEAIGLPGLSAHDCRHYWATYWAGRVDLFRLQEAGGWNSLAMPRRYTEWAAVANDGMS